MQVAEQALGVQQRGVLGEVLAVHDQVLPVHVDLHVGEALCVELVRDVHAHADVAHQDLHRRLGVLVLEEQLDAVPCADLRRLAHALDQPPPRVDVRGLERIVVTLDPRPDDQLAPIDPANSAASRVIRRASPRIGGIGVAPDRRGRTGDRGAARSRSHIRRGRPSAALHFVDVVAARAHPGSGTRSRRSARPAPRSPGGPCPRPALPCSRARAGSRPGTKRVIIGPKAQMPRLVFIAPPWLTRLAST